MKLQRSYIWKSSLRKEEYQVVLRGMVTPVEQFRLISKISAAGIVTRVLAAPETELPFWGKVEKNPIRIVEKRPSINLTPYQPIVHMTVTDDEVGSTVQILLQPHRQASMFALVEYMGAALCTTAGLIAVQETPLAGLAIALGVAIAFFPRWRESSSFEREVQRCVEALRNLPLEWSISEVSSPDS